jgi:ribosomal protein S21
MMATILGGLEHGQDLLREADGRAALGAPTPARVAREAEAPQATPPSRTYGEPREYYTLTSTRRPTNALVRIELGHGNDVAALGQALRSLKNKMQKFGAWGEIKLRADGYTSPAEKRRKKSVKARQRAQRAAARRAFYERRDPDGVQPTRRTLPPVKEVATTAS